jgi:HEAT repeat protein
MHSLILSLLLSQAPAAAPSFPPEELPAKYAAFSPQEKRRLLPLWASRGPGQPEKRYEALLALLDDPKLKDSDAALIAFVATRIQSPALAQKLAQRAKTPESRRRYAPLFAAAPGPESFAALLELTLATPADEELKTHLAATLTRECLPQVESLLHTQPELAAPFARQLLGLDRRDSSDAAALGLRLAALKSRQTQNPEAFPKELVASLVEIYKEAAKLPPGMVIQAPPEKLLEAKFPPLLHRRVAPLVAFPKDGTLRNLNLALSLGLSAEAFRQHHELLPRLFAADAKTRDAAFSSLTDKPAPLLLPALIELISDRDTQTRIAALDAIDAMIESSSKQVLAQLPPDKASPLLANTLTDSDSGVVIAATHLAMSMQLKDLSPLIASLCESTDVHVLGAAIQALSKLEGEQSQDALLRLLTHRDWSIRSRATKAIASFAAPQINPDKVHELFLKESEALIRYDLIGILAKIKSDESTLLLRSLSQDAQIPGNLRAAAVAGLIQSQKATAIDLTQARTQLDSASEEVRLAWLKAAATMQIFEPGDLKLFLSDKSSPESRARFYSLASEIKIPGLAPALKAEMGADIPNLDDLGKIFALYEISDELQLGLCLHHLDPKSATPQASQLRLERLLNFPPLPAASENSAKAAASGLQAIAAGGSSGEEVDSIADAALLNDPFGDSSSNFKLSPANHDKLRSQLRTLAASWDLPAQTACRFITGDPVSKENWQHLLSAPELRRPEMTSPFLKILNQAPAKLLKPHADAIFASLDKSSFELRYNLEKQVWIKQVSPKVILDFLETTQVDTSTLRQFVVQLKLKPSEVIRLFRHQQERSKSQESHFGSNDFFEEAAQALTGQGSSFSFSSSEVVAKDKQLKLGLADLQSLAQLEGEMQSYQLQSFGKHLSPETQSLIAEKSLSKEITGPGLSHLLACVKIKASPEALKLILSAADQGQYIPLAKSPQTLAFWQEVLEKTEVINATALCRALCFLRHNAGDDNNMTFVYDGQAAPKPTKPLLPAKFRQLLIDQAPKLPPELLSGALSVLEKDQPPQELRMALLSRLYSLPLHPHVLGSSVSPEATPLEKLLDLNGSSHSFSHSFGRSRGEKPGMAAELLKSPVRIALRENLLQALRQSPEPVLRSSRFAPAVQEFLSRSELLQNFLFAAKNGEDDYNSYQISNIIENPPGGSLTPEEISPLFEKLKTTKVSPRILNSFAQLLTPGEVASLRPVYQKAPKNPALVSLMAQHIGPDEAPLAAEFLLAAAPDFFLNPDPRMGRAYSSSDEVKPYAAFVQKLTDKAYLESLLPKLKPILAQTPDPSPTQLGLMLCLGISPSTTQIDTALKKALQPESPELDKQIVLNLAYACRRVSPDCLRLHLLVIKGAPKGQESGKAAEPSLPANIELPPNFPPEARALLIAQMAGKTGAAKAPDGAANRLAALSLSTSTHWFTPVVITGERWNFQAGNQADKRPTALEQFQMQIDFKGIPNTPPPPLNESESAALAPLQEALRAERRELIAKAEKEPALFLQLAANSDIFPDSAVLDFFTQKPELAGDPLALKAATRILTNCPEADTLKLLTRFRSMPKLATPTRKFLPVLQGLSEAKNQVIGDWLTSENPEARKFLLELRGKTSPAANPFKGSSQESLFSECPHPLLVAMCKSLLQQPSPSQELIELFSTSQNDFDYSMARGIAAAFDACPPKAITPWLKHLQVKSLLPAECQDSILPLETDLLKRRDQARQLLRFNPPSIQAVRIRTEELLGSSPSEALLLADIPFHDGHPTVMACWQQSLSSRQEQLKLYKQHYRPEQLKKQQLELEALAALHAARLKVFKQLKNPSPQCLYTLTLASPEEFSALAEPFFSRQAWPEWSSTLILLLPEDKALSHLRKLIGSHGATMAESGEMQLRIQQCRHHKILTQIQEDLQKFAPVAKTAKFLVSASDKWTPPVMKKSQEEEALEMINAVEASPEVPETPEEELEFDK